MKLKVCGLKHNITEVAQLQPDYLGFIFYDKSPRYFNGNMPQLPKHLKKVGVFVNASIAYIIEKTEQYQLNAIQLHGNESVMFCKALKAYCHSEFISESPLENPKQVQVDIIKVFSIKDSFDFSVLKAYEEVVDYFLFDTKGKQPGGNGYTFNWSVLKNYPSTKPYFLSGGIGLNEVDNVLSFLSKKESQYCYALDVNSKFEIEAGLKDIEALKQFKQILERPVRFLKYNDKS